MDTTRNPLHDANAAINKYITSSIGSNNAAANNGDPKLVVVSIAPPQKFTGQTQQPISSIVTNSNRPNGQKGLTSASDSNVNRKPPDQPSSMIGQNTISGDGITAGIEADKEMYSGGFSDAVGLSDVGDDDNDHVVDETTALEAPPTKEEKKVRQRLPSERLKEESPKERRARQRQELLRMMSPHKPREYKLCSVVVVLFIVIVVMFIVVMSLRPALEYGIYYLDGRSPERLTVDAKDLKFNIKVGEKKIVFSGHFWKSKVGSRLPLDCSDSASNETSLCLRWKDTQRLLVTHGVEGDHQMNMSCFKVAWEALNEDVWHMDCFNIAGKKWFGGGLLQSGAWSIDKISLKRVPFLTGSIHKPGSLGPVLERYWLTSEGIAVIIDDETPLHISVNSPLPGDDQNRTDESLCLYSDFDSDLSSMYRESQGVADSGSADTLGGGGMTGARRRHGPLRYSICLADSVQELHDILGRRSLSAEEPHEDNNAALPGFYRKLMQQPVWSTSQYIPPLSLNETTLLEFVGMIAGKGYGHSMLLVDKGWEKNTGDLAYDEEKFPRPQEMNLELKSKEFIVSLSVSPQIGIGSTEFITAVKNKLVVKDIGGETPSLTQLGDEYHPEISAFVDLTLGEASYWLTSRINRLLSNQLADVIYATGSDVASLPAVPTFAKTITNLNEITRASCRVFGGIGRQAVMIQSAYECKNFPLIIRLSESTSTWNQNGGLINVIASALALNIIGYPYIIPDPVGGEMEVPEGSGTSQRELYIRWMEVAIFLPVMHLSTPPHHYGNTTEKIFQELLTLRQSIVLPELMRVLNNSLNRNERPNLVRPLWWVADNSSDPTFGIEDEFLVGHRILVAPILQPGKTRRDVYLPQGLWEDQMLNQGGIHIGPKWIYNYRIPLNRVAYFIRKDLP